MAIQTTGGLTAEQKVFYDGVLLTRALPNLVHGRYGVKKSIPKNSGIVINFRRFELLSSAPSSVTALTEGTAGAESSPSVTSLNATIAQYGRWFTLTELIEDTAMDKVITEYTEMLGDQAGIDLDVVCREVLVAGTTIQYASSAGSRGQVGSGMLLSSAEIREALRTLQGNNAKPVEGGKYLVIGHPNAMADLLNDTDAKATFQYAAPRDGTNPLFSGEVGDYLGCRFVNTSQAKVHSSLGMSGADVYVTMFLGKEAYTTTELDGHSLRTYYQPRGSAGTADPLNQRSSLGYKAAYVALRLNENYLLRLEHVTTAKQGA